MKVQKTYLNQSANQILNDAEVSVTPSGLVEIFHPQFFASLQQDNDGDLILDTPYSLPVCVVCGPMARRKLEQLVEERNAKQDEVNETI